MTGPVMEEFAQPKLNREGFLPANQPVGVRTGSACGCSDSCRHDPFASPAAVRRRPRRRARASSSCAARVSAAPAPCRRQRGYNVDPADEFTRMIVPQRAYSANERVITTTDEMLNVLTHIIRQSKY